MYIYALYIYIRIHMGDPTLCTATSRIQRKFSLPWLGERRRPCLSGLGFLSGSTSTSSQSAPETFKRTKGLRGDEDATTAPATLPARRVFGVDSLPFGPRGRFPQPDAWDGRRTKACQPSPRRNRDATRPTGDAMCLAGDSPVGRRCTCHQRVPALFTSGGDGGDAGDLGGVIRPRLEVLEGEERGVVDADGVSLDGLVDGFLEGLLLQLHEDAVRLLPLGFPLLCRLPPRTEGAVRGAGGAKGGHLQREKVVVVT